MLKIQCPWCGARAQTEFSYGGEAGIVRPTETESLSDAAWGDYVFMRKNTKGWLREQWFHAAGCRRWFEAERNTVSSHFRGFYKPTPPQNDSDQTTTEAIATGASQ